MAAFKRATQGRLTAPVTEAKHLLLAVLDSINKLGDVLHRADALQHAQHCLVGAAMQGSIQSPNSTCYTGRAMCHTDECTDMCAGQRVSDQHMGTHEEAK